MLLALPVLVPMATAVILLLAPFRQRLHRTLAFVGAAAQLACAVLLFMRVESEGIQVLQVGGWPAPFGITLVADLLAALLVLATGIVGTAVTATAFAGVDPRREALGYHPLLHILLMGVAGAFLTGDLFNLYVWFEVMLVASFVLMALHRTSVQVEAAFKYVTLNLVASSVFLTALGLLYGSAGTLNMADLALAWPERDAPAVDLVLAMLFLVAFGIKAGMFPLFFWLPASYHTPPAAIGAAFAGLLTKVGVYSMIRVFTLLFQEVPRGFYVLLLGLAAATMVVGIVAALSERDFRRILSFNLVSHLGYTFVGLALLTPAALAGSLFYILHHILVITNLFLVSGVMLRLRRTTDMQGLGSFYRSHPFYALLAMVPIFSLAGVPPLSGFLGKLAIVQGTFAVGEYWVGGVVLLVGLLTLLSMAASWSDAFWAPPGRADAGTPGASILAAIGGLSLLTLAMTFGAEPIFALTSRVAEELLAPAAYVEAVLGGAQ